MASKNRKSKVRGAAGDRDKNYFSINVKLLVTDEVFSLKKVYNEMKISELKEYMEFTTGISVTLQIISYLDEGDLLDNSDVRSNDIVPGATLKMNFYPEWKTLIEAAATNDIDWVFQLGVTNPTDYRTPNSDYMTKKAKKVWLQERAHVALCIAAHRGHQKLVKKLIESGADVNGTTPLGRGALHIAAARGHGHIIDLLLEKGAKIDAEDKKGETPLRIADKFGYKTCERHLFLFRWQQRAKKTHPQKRVERRAHQFNDSSFPVWLEGPQGQMYYSNILPPGEYEGTTLNAPLRRPHPSSAKKERWRYVESEQGSESDLDVLRNGKLPPIEEDGKKKRSAKNRNGRPLTYDEWEDIQKAGDQKIREAKQKEREKKKMEEEDKKREETEKTQSYETWLQQREQENKLPGVSVQKTDFEKEHDYASFSREPYGQSKSVLRQYLESLLDTKGFTTYGDWLIRKELEMLDEANSKKPVLTRT